MSSSVTPPLAPLWSRLDNLMLRDRKALQRRLHGAAKVKNPAAQQEIMAELEPVFAAAEQRVAQRAAATPRITFPDNLPVSQTQQDIADATPRPAAPSVTRCGLTIRSAKPPRSN